ncbi:MAG: tandem-95 repeat protein [Sphingomonadaceae bacterium]|nr:tandem-95 repeat protein [Sphingomonadaceae bacterium]
MLIQSRNLRPLSREENASRLENFGWERFDNEGDFQAAARTRFTTLIQEATAPETSFVGPTGGGGGEIFVPTVLSPAQVAIIQFNSDDADDPHIPGTQSMQRDSLSFVLLAPVGLGTVIQFTDRTWTASGVLLNGGSFSAAGGGDGTYTWTAAADMAAGTVITITEAELTAAGIELIDTGEAIYVYQGAVNTPTGFLHAVEYGDLNDTFGSSLVNTGLVAGASALAIAEDNGSFGERFWNQQAALLFQNINSHSNWHTNENSPQTNQIDGTNLLVAPDIQLWIAGISGGHGIMSVSGDATQNGGLGYNVQTHFQNTAGDGNGLTTTSRFWSPTHILFDTVEGKFFIVDSSGTHDRMLQGNISDMLNNPGTEPPMTILYSEQPAVSDGIGLTGHIVDIANNHIYFTRNNVLMRVNYDTPNQTPVTLIDLGTDGDTGNANFANEIALDLANGRAFIISTESFSDFVEIPPGSGNFIVATTMHQNSIHLVSNIASGDTGVGNNTALQLNFTEAYDDDNNAFGDQLDEFDNALGKITSIDINQSTGEIWFTTVQLNGGTDGSVGGIYRATLSGGNTLNVTTIYSETNASNLNFLHIHVDEETGFYYVTSQEPGEQGNHSVLRGALNAAAGTPPSFFATVGNINEMVPRDLTVESAPTLTGSALAAAVTEASSALNSGETSTPLLFGSLTAADLDTPNTGDELAGAQVRISASFQSGAGHQDFLRINNLTSGTIGGSGIGYSYDQTTGVMTLTGAATVAEYQAALQLVTFSTSGDNITNYGAAGSRIVSASVFDGLLYSDELHNNVTVTGINDAPVNTIQAAALGIGEDATNVVLSTSGNAISVFDADANPATQNITVTLSVTQGALTILTNVAGGIVAGEITGGANGSGTITITTTQNKINATLAALNGLLYNPIADYNGVDTLTIVTNDQGLNGNDPGLTGTPTSEQDSDTRTINIAPVVDIANDGGATSEDAAVNILVLANDSFENVEAITGVTQGANGAVTIHDNGTAGNTTDDYLVYTANADFNGTDSFQYTVTSGGVTEQATVNVTISAVVDIANDGATTDEDTAVNVLVFANDSFEASNEAITAFGQGSNGSVALNDNGTAGDTTDDYLVYTPNSDFNGSDSFTYTVSSGGVTEQATVNVTITAIDDAIDDNYSVIEDSGANTLDLLGNDSFESTGRFISAVTQGLHGSVAIHDNGTAGDATDDYVVYTVTDPDYSGGDSFTYTVTSGGVTEDATVNVSIQAANDAPTSTNIAGDTIVWAENDSPQTLDLGTNATLADIDSADFDTGTLTVSISGGLVAAEDELSVEDDANVTVTGNTIAVGGVDIATFSGGGAGGGDLVFTFDSDATPARVALLIGAICYSNAGGDNPTDGDRTIGWTLVDGDGVVNAGADTLSFTTTVNVDPIDDGPEARDDAFTTDEATPIIGGDLFADNGSGVDSDPDGPALAITEVNGGAANVGVQITLASGALLTVNADGSFDYDPNGAFDATPDAASGASNASPTDSFTYTVGGVSTATVTITVNGLDSRDFALGTAGADSIDAGLLGDWIVGLQGSDTLFGNTGSDTLIGGSGGDSLIGGGGSDWAAYRMAGAAITADLAAGTISSVSTGADTVTGIENVIGTGNADGIAGDGLDNELWGRDGDDTLAGRAGRDTLRGGTGADRFDLAGLNDADADKIVDFEAGTDLLGLNGAAYGLAPGALDPNVFVIGNQALDADDRVIYDSSEGKLYFDADGVGGAGKILIAKLIDLPVLSASDFIVT